MSPERDHRALGMLKTHTGELGPILQAVADERQSQDQKWGEQNWLECIARRKQRRIDDRLFADRMTTP